MLNEQQIGQNGRKPERCAISGRALDPEDIYFKVNGRYLGVKPREWRFLSQTEQDAMRAQWGSEVPADEAKNVAAVTSPDYEAQSLADLKALAEQRKVDITGKSGKPAIIQALRVADVSERFSPAVEAEVGQPLDLSGVKGN